MMKRNLVQTALVGLFFIFAGFSPLEDCAFQEEYNDTLIALAETGEAREDELFSDEVPASETVPGFSKESCRIDVDDSCMVSVFGEKNSEFSLPKDSTIEEEYEETLIALAETGEAHDDELFPDEVPDSENVFANAKEPYRIGVGDSFMISVFGEKNTDRTVVVDFTGSIYYRFNEPIFVLGKTIEEVRTILNNQIHRIFPARSVTITPHQFAGRFYTILGEVVAPGKKLLQGKTTVMTALCAAGGFRTGAFRAQTIDMQDLNHTFLARRGDYVPIDFTKLVNDGDLSQDVELQSGDYLFVPSALSREIYVLGEVNTPTTIGYVHTISLVEALCEARGMGPRASSRIIVIRGSLVNPIQFQIDIRRILRGTEPNFILQPGDIVFVPVRRFQTLREITQSGIRAFVSAVAEFAGGKYFTEVVTKAAARNQKSETPDEAVENATIINSINNAILTTTNTANATNPATK